MKRIFLAAVLVLLLAIFVVPAYAQESGNNIFNFDLSGLGVFALAVLIPGIVQSLKEQFGVTGRWAFVTALLLGMFFVGLGEAINQGLVSELILPWLTVGVVGVAGGLAAAGYYDLLLKPLQDRLNA